MLALLAAGGPAEILTAGDTQTYGRVQTSRCQQTAAALQLPYALWVAFAGCRNLAVSIMNRRINRFRA